MDLDPYQLAAATAQESRVLVSAAPGSGKTRVLTARFKFMVNDLHCLASQTALITFTRHAANEIRERIGETCGSAFIGTFHGWALNMIKMYGRRREWEPEWLTILDEKDVEDEEHDILQSLGFLSRTGTWKKCKAAEWYVFRNQMNNGEPVSDEQWSMFGVAWRLFMDRLRAENVLTFGTIISEAIEMMEDEHTASEIRTHFRHVLIDECQDSDAQQYRLVEMMDPKTLFLVGDVDQSIYSWRSGRPDLFIQYAQNSTVYQLPNSYRFGFNIAQPANCLIKHNTERIDSAIQAIAENNGEVCTVMESDYTSTADMILEELKDGRKPEEIAVLARRHKTLESLGMFMEQRNVPYFHPSAKNSVEKSSELRTVKGYLRLAVNELDKRAFMAISSAEEISTSELIEIRMEALETGLPFVEIYKSRNPEWEQPETIDDIEEYLKPKGSHYMLAVDYVKQVMMDEALVETQEIVHYLAVQSVQDQFRKKQTKGKVLLTTGHAAKGLEWPVVFVVGLNAKHFPSRKSLTEGREEEERRILYVQMTRAEEKLYLINNAPESRDDGPSRFLIECGSLNGVIEDEENEIREETK
jgi:superfamily I DNA/RNA helicase